MKRVLKIYILLAIAVHAWAGCPTDPRGVCANGLTTVQESLLGALIPDLASLWIYGDKMEKAVIDNMAPKALAEAPTLPGSPLAGTVSWTAPTATVNTTADQTGAVSLFDYLVFTWPSVDGANTGRVICPVSAITSTTITCSNNIFAPSSSGVTAYKMSATPGPSGFTFLGWDPQNGASVSTTWNYYDPAIGLYRFYYRNLTSTYQTYARNFADIQWQWTLDHGYGNVIPRASALLSQFFRVTEGHTERLPGLYNYISGINTANSSIGDVTTCMAQLNLCDNRESGYTLWAVATGAKVETDSSRHGDYCTWLATDTASWNATQYSDGSWGQHDFFQNTTYVSAPLNYTDSPLHFGASPWRMSINVKAMEASYESLSDTTTQGCNNGGANTALAAATLTAITNAVTWQRNYGRDTTNRGTWYTVNSQSNEQLTVAGTGTVDANLGSPDIVGHGTNWQTAGYCGGNYFIGTITPWHGTVASSHRGVYKILSCTDNFHAKLTVNWGVFGESFNEMGMSINYAPAASSSCGTSLSQYCISGAGTGDRNLTRTICGATAWLYAKTLNPTYKVWSDECVSSVLGGPTAGPTSADTENGFTPSVPCGGPGADCYTGDTGNAMSNCGDVSSMPPCMFGNTPYSHLFKDWSEAFGAPGIDNALAWRIPPPISGGVPSSSKRARSGKAVNN